MSTPHRRSRVTWVAVGLAILFVQPTSIACADPSLLFARAPFPDRPADLWQLRITNTGSPITIRGLRLNGQCAVYFYGHPEPQFSPTNHDRLMSAWTDDQFSRMTAKVRSEGKPANDVKLTLPVQTGESARIFIPAVLPMTAFAGLLGAGSCGLDLNRIAADTDAGEVDWQGQLLVDGAPK